MSEYDYGNPRETQPQLPNVATSLYLMSNQTAMTKLSRPPPPTTKKMQELLQKRKSISANAAKENSAMTTDDDNEIVTENNNNNHKNGVNFVSEPNTKTSLNDENQNQILERAQNLINDNNDINKLYDEFDKKDVKLSGLLSIKPKLYVCNVDEQSVQNGNKYTKDFIEKFGNENTLIVSADIENQINEVNGE